VNINGISLLGKHNPSAMETLRKAMHEEGPVPGIISLTVARRRYEDPDQFQGSSSSAATSLNSNGGGNSSSNNNSGTFQQLQQQVQQVQQVGNSFLFKNICDKNVFDANRRETKVVTEKATFQIVYEQQVGNSFLNRHLLLECLHIATDKTHLM
jgi:hypothetical protein